MATKLITAPRGDDGNFSFQVELDGVVFLMVFLFNRRADVWYFDLLTQEGVAIRRSIKLTTGWPWLRQVQRIGRPAGELLALDTTQAGISATFDTLNDTIQFIYEEAATVP